MIAVGEGQQGLPHQASLDRLLSSTQVLKYDRAFTALRLARTGKVESIYYKYKTPSAPANNTLDAASDLVWRLVKVVAVPSNGPVLPSSASKLM